MFKSEKDATFIDIEKTPRCSPLVYTYLKEAFELDFMLTVKHKNNDELVGYIRGVQDVLHRIEFLADIKEEE